MSCFDRTLLLNVVKEYLTEDEKMRLRQAVQGSTHPFAAAPMLAAPIADDPSTLEECFRHNKAVEEIYTFLYRNDLPENTIRNALAYTGGTKQEQIDLIAYIKKRDDESTCYLFHSRDAMMFFLMHEKRVEVVDLIMDYVYPRRLKNNSVKHVLDIVYTIFSSGGLIPLDIFDVILSNLDREEEPSYYYTLMTRTIQIGMPQRYAKCLDLRLRRGRESWLETPIKYAVQFESTHDILSYLYEQQT